MIIASTGLSSPFPGLRCLSDLICGFLAVKF